VAVAPFSASSGSSASSEESLLNRNIAAVESNKRWEERRLELLQGVSTSEHPEKEEMADILDRLQGVTFPEKNKEK